MNLEIGDELLLVSESYKRNYGEAPIKLFGRVELLSDSVYDNGNVIRVLIKDENSIRYDTEHYFSYKNDEDFKRTMINYNWAVLKEDVIKYGSTECKKILSNYIKYLLKSRKKNIKEIRRLSRYMKDMRKNNV